MRKPVIVVTGASRGIGKAIALRFSQIPCCLAICCHKQEQELYQVKNEIEKNGCSCLSYIGNMGHFEHAQDFFSKIQEAFGIPDLLVNNAGISRIGLVQDMSEEQWNELLISNLSSTFFCSQEAVKLMLKQKRGKIINISSVWGSAGASMEVAYSATKGGINAMTRALAKELAPSNIQVNALACGAIQTQMNQFLSKEEMQQLIEEIPANRLGTVEDIAECTWQLAHASSYLTGQIITVDGGWI